MEHYLPTCKNCLEEELKLSRAKSDTIIEMFVTEPVPESIARGSVTDIDIYVYLKMAFHWKIYILLGNIKFIN